MKIERMMTTNIIIDGNNILYRTFFANNKSGEPDEVVISWCVHSALKTMNRYHTEYMPDNMIVTFDSYSWRKLFTSDLSKCVTNKKYKGFRRVDITPKQQKMFKLLDDHIDDFCEMLKRLTGVIVLRQELLEGDDLMAGWVQMHRDDTNIVVSGDKDMMQLMRYNGVTVVNPATGKPQSLAEWNNDVDIFMFVKCIRGEAKTNDNIQSSYPRLQLKKILRAFEDPFIMTSIMEHTFSLLEELPDGSHGDTEYKTSELFAENEILMDLRKQPKTIKVAMVKTILEARENQGRYNHIKFIQYCVKNDFLAIVNDVETFAPMLRAR